MRTRLCAALFGVAVLVTASPALAAEPADPLSSMVLGWLNEDRSRADISPLELDDHLCRVARAHAQEMVDLGYYSHFSPVTGWPSSRVSRAGIAFRRVGENIAAGWTAQSAYTALTLSPSHRANIMSPAFDAVGIAVAQGPHGWYYLVQLFITRPVADNVAGAP